MSRPMNIAEQRQWYDPAIRLKNHMALPPDLSGSANDHQFRSKFIQWLLQQPPPPSGSRQIGRDPITRVLVQYWHDLKHIPDDVQECLKSWESLRNHGFRRLIFD